jgi:hypothetical protein
MEPIIRHLVAGLHPGTSLMIVSDHGMMNTSLSKMIVLDELINIDMVNITSIGPVTMLNAKNFTDIPALFNTLLLNSTNNHYEVFLNHGMQDSKPQWHYGNSDRIGDIVIVAEIGWMVTEHKIDNTYGAHGWDPFAPEMHAIFNGFGPCFKSDVVGEALQNTELYTMMTRCLGIKGAETNGTSEGLRIIDSLMV